MCSSDRKMSPTPRRQEIWPQNSKVAWLLGAAMLTLRDAIAVVVEKRKEEGKW